MFVLGCSWGSVLPWPRVVCRTPLRRRASLRLRVTIRGPRLLVFRAFPRGRASREMILCPFGWVMLRR